MCRKTVISLVAILTASALIVGCGNGADSTGAGTERYQTVAYDVRVFIDQSPSSDAEANAAKAQRDVEKAFRSLDPFKGCVSEGKERSRGFNLIVQGITGYTARAHRETIWSFDTTDDVCERYRNARESQQSDARRLQLKQTLSLWPKVRDFFFSDEKSSPDVENCVKSIMKEVPQSDIMQDQKTDIVGALCKSFAAAREATSSLSNSFPTLTTSQCMQFQDRSENPLCSDVVGALRIAAEQAGDVEQSKLARECREDDDCKDLQIKQCVYLISDGLHAQGSTNPDNWAALISNHKADEEDAGATRGERYGNLFDSDNFTEVVLATDGLKGVGEPEFVENVSRFWEGFSSRVGIDRFETGDINRCLNDYLPKK